MSEWKARRFWTDAAVVPQAAGFAVHLDGRPVRTPGKQPLVVPTRGLADAIAAEWAAQQDTIDPRTMPATRSANSAIDKVAPQTDAVARMLADYGDADLTCYRAAEPAELVARQGAAWDPLLKWADEEFGARLIPVQGVIHVPQPAVSLARLSAPLHGMSAFELTGFHDLVSLSGSLVIGLAAIRRHLPIDTLWTLSRIDETWQREQWGADDEADRAAENKRLAFLEAWEFYRLTQFSN